MNWIEPLLDEVEPLAAYLPGERPAAEPTAIATMALAGGGRAGDAARGAQWLAEHQAPDGSVPVWSSEPEPRWPTGLAVLAWLAVGQSGGPDHSSAILKAVEWILKAHGKPIDEAELVGHNTRLVAWPWVAGTHSWIEPTAVQLLALRAAGYHEHARAAEAVRLLLDRQLPDGGCNYGNTFVLGQQLRPHVQPTGLAMLALAGHTDARIERSLGYLSASLSGRTTTSSLVWGLLGLAAHGRRPTSADAWLEAAWHRCAPPCRFKFALIAAAALGERSPLVNLPTLMEY